MGWQFSWDLSLEIRKRHEDLYRQRLEQVSRACRSRRDRWRRRCIPVSRDEAFGEGIGPSAASARWTWKDYVVAGMDSTAIEVSALLTDRNGGIWVGTGNRGIYRIHGGRADHFDSADGLSSDSVQGLYEDREGDLWVATSRGIDRFHDDQRDQLFDPRRADRRGRRFGTRYSRRHSIHRECRKHLIVLREGKLSCD